MTVTVWLLAVVIRRLLGVRLGPVRTILAAVIVLFLTPPILQGFAPVDRATVGAGEAILLSAVSIVIAALLAMVALVILEVLLPTGSLPGPLELWRGAGRRLARVRRYWTIIRIAL